MNLSVINENVTVNDPKGPSPYINIENANKTCLGTGKISQQVALF